MKKTLCALLALCLAIAGLPAVSEEEPVSAPVEAAVPEAWTTGEDNGLWAEGDLTPDAFAAGDAFADGEAFGVSAAADGEAVALGPDAPVAGEAELALTPEVPEETPVEHAGPAVNWIAMPETVIEASFPVEDDRDPDALFAAYANGVLYDSGRPRLMSTNNTGRQLPGGDYLIYAALKEAVEQVAAGSRASTVVDIPVEELLGKAEFTAAELGVEMAYDADGAATSDSLQALQDAYTNLFAFHYDAILNALWFDCAYELYWFDRYRTGVSRRYPACWFVYDDAQQDYAVLVDEGGAVSISLSVLEQYAGDAAYTVDTALTSGARQAAANARRIVDAYADCSDFTKLYAYAAEICRRVQYNTPAAGSGWDNREQNPWKLIWVFDGDPDTNVVCEGYSLAFQYLCELSCFDSGVRCFMVSGDAGGAHAWNLVRMDDGKYYVVDVTWMDGGWADSLSGDRPVTAALVSQLPGGGWFLVGGSGSVSKGYTVATRGGASSFRRYYDDTVAANSAAVLALAPGAYVLNGFQRVNGATYYFDDGAFVTGERTIDGQDFDFGDDGALVGAWTPGAHTVDGRKYYFDEDGLHTEHSVEVLPAVPATCEADGMTEGRRCSVCGAVLLEQDAVPATGHLWGMAEYALSDDGATMTARRVCLRDSGHVQSETALTDSEVTAEPTCTEMGDTTYTARFENRAFSKQSRTRTDVPALGHAWGEVEYALSDDCRTMTARRVCGRDSGHVEIETVLTEARVATEPTCTEMGDTTYAARFENPAFEAQTRTLTDIPARGHAPVVDPAVAPTYDSTGLTEGSHCAVCGQVLTAQAVVDALPRVRLEGAEIAVKAQVYTGAPLTPAPTVALDGETLVENVDYTVAWANNLAVGKATLTVTGVGKYEGTLSAAFRINPKKPSGLALKAGARALTVSWKRVRGVTGYQVQYCLKKSFKGAKTVTVKGEKKLKVTLKKLKSKKAYYVRVRAYRTVKGVKYCSAWSAAKRKATK